MMTVQAMIHGQETSGTATGGGGGILRRPDSNATTRPTSSISAKSKIRRKGSSKNKKKDAAAGGGDVMEKVWGLENGQSADLLQNSTQPTGNVVAREWLLLKNTELQQLQDQQHQQKVVRVVEDKVKEQSASDCCSCSRGDPIRKDSSGRKNKTRDANGNVKLVKEPRSGVPQQEMAAHTTVPQDLDSGVHRGDTTQGDIPTKHTLLRDAPQNGDVTIIMVQPPEEVVIESHDHGDGSLDKGKAQDTGHRKNSLHFTPETSTGEKRERRSGSKGSGGNVKRHSSSRSTGSEGSTLRRMRRRGTQHNSTSTQTPPGSHSELHHCTIPPDNKRGSRVAEGDQRGQEEAPRRDLAGSIPGASLLLKLVMPREKRLSRHSGGSPTRDVPPPSSRAPTLSPVPWFWPPIRHVESANPSPLPPVSRGPSPKCGSGGQGLAFGGGEAGASVPFPPRAAPPVPCQLDQISVSSLCSSLAGHTYEQVNFVLEPPISESKENEYELGKEMITDCPVEKEEILRQELCHMCHQPCNSCHMPPQGSEKCHIPHDEDESSHSSHPPRTSGGRQQEAPEAEQVRRPSSRRKRKKSRCAATITDHSPEDDLPFTCPKEPVVNLGRRVSLEEDRLSRHSSSPLRRLSTSPVYQPYRRASFTCGSTNSLAGEYHIATLEKPMTLVSEKRLEIGCRTPSLSPPLLEEPRRCQENVEKHSPDTDSPSPRDAVLINHLLTLVKADGAHHPAGSQTSPVPRHNPRRHGVYVPLDPESDTGATSEPELCRDAEVFPIPAPQNQKHSISNSVEHQQQHQQQPPSARGRSKSVCPLHDTAIPYHVGLSPALQRQRTRRASLPVPVIPEPRPSLMQRLRRSLRRSRNVEPLIAELPTPAELLQWANGSDPQQPPGEPHTPATEGQNSLPSEVSCSCPDALQEFRRFRPRISSTVSEVPAVSSDEDCPPQPTTPQVILMLSS